MASTRIDPSLAVLLFVEIDSSDECWPWTGSRDVKGYGRLKVDGKSYKAHRLAFQILAGLPLGEDDHLHHRCENPACCNPFHLEPIANGDHMRLGNTPPALNARKSHCSHGHPFDAENTAFMRRRRYCRQCRRERALTRYHQLREAA